MVVYVILYNHHLLVNLLNLDLSIYIIYTHFKTDIVEVYAVC